MRFYRELRRNLHPVVDNTEIELFTSGAWSVNGTAVKNGLAAGLPLPDARAPRPSISLIATVKNEAATIEAWLDSLLTQTRLPNEIVIVDGGSTDGTFERLQGWAARSPIPVKTLQAAGVNIARGRNLAIEQASGPIIASTDAGCLVPAGWLAAISGPFAVNPNLEVVAGYYEAIQCSDLQRLIAIYLVPPISLIKPQEFLPSARSLAFRKAAWHAAGGFPEWLTLTGEDTLFDIRLKRHTTRWAFVPEATVSWYLKSSLRQLFRQVRTYGRGDGQAGLFPDLYWDHLSLWVGLGLAGLLCLICLLLTLVSKNWRWLLAALPLVIWLARRLWRATIRPTVQINSGHRWPDGPVQKIKVFVLSMTVMATITLALAIGYVEGVRLRLERI